MKNFQKFIKLLLLISATIFVLLLVFSIKVYADVDLPERPIRFDEGGPYNNMDEWAADIDNYIDELLIIIEEQDAELMSIGDPDELYDRAYWDGYTAGYEDALNGTQDEPEDTPEDASTNSQTKTKIITKIVEKQTEPVQYNGNELIIPIADLGNYEWEIGYRCPLNPNYIILHGGTLWEVRQKTPLDILMEESNAGTQWKPPSE